MSFKVGQKVVCVKQGDWYGVDAPPNTFPQYDQIYTVDSTRQDSDNSWISIVGWPEEWFVTKNFRALDEAFAEEVLENIKEQIEEEELVRI